MRPPRGVRVERARLGNVACEWLLPERSSVPGAVLYLHAGGFVMGGPATARSLAGRIARATGARVVVPAYRLAPEHGFPAQLDDAVIAYRGLLSMGLRGDDVVIVGASAGGSLALALLVTLRDACEPLPAGTVLLSPCTDLTRSGKSFVERADDDALLSPELCRESGRLYLQGHDSSWPLASPLFADLHGLPPLFVQVGSEEMLLDDSRRLIARARAVGVDATLEVWPGLFHVFQFFSFVPESREAVAHVARFVRARLLDRTAASTRDGNPVGT